ncbi:MAG: YfiR family protein [Candidatus Aminicenantes bacterium]|nr:MAG: YfiR family protein [Candidatus Aminicenantes bacterium]
MKKTILFFLFSLAILMLFTSVSISSHAMEEYQIKSGLLYRICKFTHWPTPPDANKPFIISILGRTPPGKEIKMPQDVTIDKRKIVIRKIKNLSEINGSDVLFITTSETYRLDAILDYIGDKPVMTVGDTKGFAQRGIIINFYIQSSRVRFEINYEASKKASLQMHSQLFAIGRVVKTKRSFNGDGEK